MNTEETLIVILMFLFGVFGFVVLQNEVSAIDTTSWAFTGSEFIIALLPFVSYIYLVVMMTVPVYRLFREYS